MRNTTTIGSTIVLLTIVAFIACSKEENGGGAPVPLSTSSLRDLFEQHVLDATQTFNLNATAGGQITGSEGTILTFQPNALRDGNGNMVSGTVQVKLVEALKIGDMIWLNKQTVGNDFGTTRMLRSGGEIRVTASQGGNELRLASNGLMVRIPTTNPDPNMQVFRASAATDTGMVWNRVDSSEVDTTYYLSSFYYTLTTDSLQWINCDYFGSYPNTTNITATLPVGQPHDSTMVWIAFPTENAMMQMYFSGSSYTTWQVVPVGMTATVIGLARINGQYTSAFSTVSITAGMDVPLTFAPTTLAQFQTACDAL